MFDPYFIFGRPFVKRYALCYQTAVCLSVCLSVCDVCALWTNGWTDQDETWHAGRRSLPWPHCVRWGPTSPSAKGAQPPVFGPYLLRPNGCMDQDVTWCAARPRPRRLCVRWGPSPLAQKGAEPPPQFSAHFYCGQTAGCTKMPLGTEVGLSPGDFVLDGDRVLTLQKGGGAPIFGPCLLWSNGWMDQDSTWHEGRPQPRGLCVR